jgi:DNA repair exonuclease SbcCD ATPase subunit
MRPMFSGLRRFVLGSGGGTAVAEQVQDQQGRLDTQHERLASQRQRLDKQREDIKALRADLRSQAQAVNEQKRAVAKLQAEMQPLKQADRLREIDWGRAMHQLGALEVRVGRLEEAAGDGDLDFDDSALAEARSLVDAVRREHDQARVRFQVISSYEERMRRLEAAVVQMYDGDMRHTL